MAQPQETTEQAEGAGKISDEKPAATFTPPAPSATAQDASGPQGPAPPRFPRVTGAELPPQLSRISGMTTEEVFADLNKSPLFMTELEENDDVAALQALAYEGTPLENASDFKDRGNECFRDRLWADAREFYGKGVAILVDADRRRARGEPPTREGDSDAPDEVARQHAVLEALYANRAACQLELRNFRSCTLDCAAALRLNPRNAKALYRSGRALLALDRVAEADDACARGLGLDGANAALRGLAEDIARRHAQVTARQRQEDERVAREKRRAMLLRAVLKARNIRTRKTEQPPEMEDARVQLVPDPDDARSELSFPTVLLYPTDLESDFIKSFAQTQSLAQHLEYIFPLPWDEKGAYTADGVECYMETHAGGLIKVGKKMTLLKILGGGRVEVVDDLLKIFIVPKANADAWVQEFKTKKAAEKGS